MMTINQYFGLATKNPDWSIVDMELIKNI